MLCERAIVDSRSNNMSLMGVVEQFNVPDLPTTIPQIFDLAMLWEKDDSLKGKDEAFSFKIVITQKKREVSINKGKTYEINIPKNKYRLRSISSIRGIPVKEEKTLYFRIYVKSKDKWEKIFSIPIEIKKVTA